MTDWDGRFLALAAMVAGWSKDPSARHGAVLTDARRRVLSVGYNGLPRRIRDLPERLTDPATRRALTVFAEENALVQCEIPVGPHAVLYSTGFPPARAAKQIAQRGVARLVCPKPATDAPDVVLARGLLTEAGVEIRHRGAPAIPKAPKDWDARLVALAGLIASWSKDPSTQVGAVVVDDRRRLLSVGYNGFPRGVADLPERLNDRPTKYALVCHAEENALTQCETPIRHGATLYASLFPCQDCAKLALQRGITRICAPAPDLSHPRWGGHFATTLALLTEAGVEVAAADPAGPVQPSLGLPEGAAVAPAKAKPVRRRRGALPPIDDLFAPEDGQGC
jgi:dCMP deaminase